MREWAATLLGVVFVTLKLIGIIHWSWWWVTLPFWGFAAVCLVIVAVLVGVNLACDLIVSKEQ